jgi:hypothetical protein
MKLVHIAPLFAAASCFGQMSNPNHLEPITPLDDGYRQLVFDTLLSKPAVQSWMSSGGMIAPRPTDPDKSRTIREPQVWMIGLPSFSPEYAVILYSEFELPDLQNGGKWDPDDKRRWILEVATATQRIWHWKEHPQGYVGPVELDPRRNVKVERIDIPVEKHIAIKLEEAWTAVTRQTRYPDKQYGGGADGETYQFYAGRCFGETWSPTDGLPAALVQSAENLIKIAKAAPEKRDGLWKNALNEAEKIQLLAGKSKDGGK